MISGTIDEGTEGMQSRRSTRPIGKGDDAYTETLKQFTGIPSDLCNDMRELIKQRKTEAGRKVKIGDVYGEMLNGYMDEAESGRVQPDIKAQARGAKAVNVGVWIRGDTVDRFEKFVSGLGQGEESEVLAASLRWFLKQ